ncbi:hydroxyacid dehydrogenase [Haloplanus litoreus]|uniref:Hydroxyacid dehydrogenase n=1 Tax=Haloplanus litoreus TaxID=767515 RepID=A0ABD6A2C2_9EURY
MTEREWNVLLPKDIDPAGPESIDDIASFTSISEFGLAPDDLKPHIDQFDAIILRKAELTGAVLEAADNLKIIAKHGVGLDNVDIDAASEHGIIVCNTPGANARSVAEHALTLLLGVNRRLVAMDSATRNGKWDRQRWSSHEIAGKTVGLFGCGDIGQVLAELADCLDLDVLGYDPYLGEDDLPDVITKVEETSTLFEQSDAVSIHSPLTDETHHAISAQELEELGAEGILINTARGPIVDESALVTALRNEVIFGAGIDVFEREPPADDNALFDLENVILSQHVGGVTREAMRRMSTGAAECVRARYRGETPDTAVNAGESDS